MNVWPRCNTREDAVLHRRQVTGESILIGVHDNFGPRIVCCGGITPCTRCQRSCNLTRDDVAVDSLFDTDRRQSIASAELKLELHVSAILDIYRDSSHSHNYVERLGRWRSLEATVKDEGIHRLRIPPLRIPFPARLTA